MPVNRPSLGARFPIIKFLGPLQGTDSFLERNQSVAYFHGDVRLIAASYDDGDSVRHINVENVYTMRFTCSGAARRAMATMDISNRYFSWPQHLPAKLRFA